MAQWNQGAGAARARLFPYYWFLDFARSLRQYLALAGTSTMDDFWPPEFFPVLYGVGGDHVCLAQSGSGTASVWEITKGEMPIKIFESLEDALGAATCALLTGSWALDPATGTIDTA